LLQYYAMSASSIGYPRRRIACGSFSLADAQCPDKLSDVVSFVSAFLLPVAGACANGDSFERQWTPRGPWSAGS
jgi:hypothetical protein